MTKKDPKICFVICPIGPEGSEIRQRSDEVLNEIIKPAVQQCGYEHPIRGDEITQPGIITMQLLDRIYEADLVIADLTDHNPNVFYELAFRHAVKRPVITIIEADQELPFDIHQVRAIKFRRDLTGGRKCEEDIVKQITSIEENPDEIDSPISLAFDYKQLRDSKDLLSKGLSMIMDKLDDIRSMLRSTARATVITEPIPPSRFSRFDPDYWQSLFSRVDPTRAWGWGNYPYFDEYPGPPELSKEHLRKLAEIKAKLSPEAFNILAAPLRLSRNQISEINALEREMRDEATRESEEPDDGNR